MKATTHLVLYKDSRHAQELKFGPFASTSLAEEFMGDLPMPLHDGYKRLSIIQPYTHQDLAVIITLITNAREKLRQPA